MNLVLQTFGRTVIHRMELNDPSNFNLPMGKVLAQRSGRKYPNQNCKYWVGSNIFSRSCGMYIPGALLGPQETIRASISQGSLLPRLRIRSGWYIVGHPRSPLCPYAMGHCQPPCFHGLWNIRAILAETAPRQVLPLWFNCFILPLDIFWTVCRAISLFRMTSFIKLQNT